MVSLKVEEEMPSFNSTQTAKLSVRSHGQTRINVPAKNIEPLQSDRASIPSDTAKQEKVLTFPKKCTPDLKGLLHFDDKGQKLYQCDGISWNAWGANAKATKCPFGWTPHDSSCYKHITEQKATWITAARICQEQYDATLVKIFSKEQMNWLWNFSGRKSFWIGLTNRGNNANWEWSTGEKTIFTNWKGRPPHRTRKGKNCVIVQKKGKWHVKNCQKSNHYICSKQV